MIRFASAGPGASLLSLLSSCFGRSLFLASLPLSAWAGDLKVVGSRCEQARDPLGVDVPAPRLSWKLESSTPGQRQTACQILVASSPKLLGEKKADLWDSGKTLSDATVHVPYGGKALRSSQQVFWKVRAWDKAGKPSAWSEAASWTMGVLKDEDWMGRWIGAVTVRPPARPSIGYHAGETTNETDLKWVQVNLDRPHPISAIELHPMNHQNKSGFGFPPRFKVEVSGDVDFKEATVIADHTAADFPGPGDQPVRLEGRGIAARYVRVTATKLWKLDSRHCFALCQLAVISEGQNVAKSAPVTARDSVEKYGWGKAGLTDALCGAAVPPPEPQSLLLRKDFVVKPGLRRALAHVSGLGCYEMSANGKKLGDALFPPGWTKYDKTCLYDTYELTSTLQKGTNTVGLLLGNGMYNVVGGRYCKFAGSFGPLKAIAQLRLEYADGSVETLGTDGTWRLTPGPITFSCVFGGEDYDARLEPLGWNQPGCDDSTWEPAKVVPGPGGKLKGLSCAAPPIQTFEVLKPVRVTEPKSGIIVYDLGQNVSLMPRLRVHGPAGAKVRITPAELLDEKGLIDRESCGGGESYWQYTLSGGGEEGWFPRFFYHGSRYLQVERQPAPGGELPALDSLEGLVVHAASEPVGSFACSNDLFNRVHRLIRWAQRSNMMSLMTDCPHREKLGWLEENHLNGPSLRYEFDLARLFAKSMNDMQDSQLENGLVPDIAPEYVQFEGGFRDSPEWGSAFILVPWQQYEFTGDTELLRRYYDAMTHYVAYLGSRAKGHIVSHGLGDWYDIGPKPPGIAQLTPLPLTATAFYYYDTWILARAAQLLGKTDDAARYKKLAAEIRDAFNKEFFQPATAQYATGSQCANSIPLVMDLVPAESRQAVLQHVVDDVRQRGNALTAGDVGYRYLLQALAGGGRSDVIFDVNNQSEKPGYGYQLKQGATSLTEAWDALRKSSQNHFMLGQIMEWFYANVAGIQCDPAGPGFKQILIKPTPVGDLTWAKASYDSVRGRIASSWERQGDTFVLTVTIPVNSTANIWVPAQDLHRITVNNQPALRSKLAALVRQEKEHAVFAVGSGQFTFKSR